MSFIGHFALAVYGGYGERQFAVRCSNGTVAVRLLGVVIVLLHIDPVVYQELRVVLYGGKISGRQIGCFP